MKATPLALRCVILVAAGTVAFAGQKPDKADPSPKRALSAVKQPASTPAPQESEAPTGSYIPRRLHRAGTITDGASTLCILDRDTLNQTGAATLREALVRRGFGR